MTSLSLSASISGFNPTQHSNEKLKFKQLKDGKKDRWDIVRNVFNTIIAPIYGSQESALDKVKRKDGRTCRILYADKEAVGLVVYKKSPTDEYGLKNSLEIKTLCLVDPKKHSNKGYGKFLLEKALDVAKEKDADSIHVTVSDMAKDALAFFQKRGFEIVSVFPGKYKVGVNENLLCLRIKQVVQAPFASMYNPEQELRRAGDTIQTMGNGSHSSSSQSSSQFTYSPPNSSKEDLVTLEDEAELLRKMDQDFPENSSPKSPSKFTHSPSKSSSSRSNHSNSSARSMEIDSSSHSSNSNSSSSKPRLPASENDSHSHSNSSAKPMQVESFSPSKKRTRDDKPEKEEDGRYNQNAPNKRSRVDETPSNNRGWPSQVERIPLKQQYLAQIASGQKTVEGRIHSHPFNRLKAGMEVQFHSNSGQVNCIITKINIYSSFREMLAKEGVAACLPGVGSVDAGAAIYDAIPNYTQKAQKFGVMAIQLKKK